MCSWKCTCFPGTGPNPHRPNDPPCQYLLRPCEGPGDATKRCRALSDGFQTNGTSQASCSSDGGPDKNTYTSCTLACNPCSPTSGHPCVGPTDCDLIGSSCVLGMAIVPTVTIMHGGELVTVEATPDLTAWPDLGCQCPSQYYFVDPLGCVARSAFDQTSVNCRSPPGLTSTQLDNVLVISPTVPGTRYQCAVACQAAGNGTQEFCNLTYVSHPLGVSAAQWQADAVQSVANCYTPDREVQACSSLSSIYTAASGTGVFPWGSLFPRCSCASGCSGCTTPGSANELCQNVTTVYTDAQSCLPYCGPSTPYCVVGTYRYANLNMICTQDEINAENATFSSGGNITGTNATNVCLYWSEAGRYTTPEVATVACGQPWVSFTSSDSQTPVSSVVQVTPTVSFHARQACTPTEAVRYCGTGAVGCWVENGVVNLTNCVCDKSEDVIDFPDVVNDSPIRGMRCVRDGTTRPCTSDEAAGFCGETGTMGCQMRVLFVSSTYKTWYEKRSVPQPDFAYDTSTTSKTGGLCTEWNVTVDAMPVIEVLKNLMKSVEHYSYVGTKGIVMSRHAVDEATRERLPHPDCYDSQAWTVAPVITKFDRFDDSIDGDRMLFDNPDQRVPCAKNAIYQTSVAEPDQFTGWDNLGQTCSIVGGGPATANPLCWFNKSDDCAAYLWVNDGDFAYDGHLEWMSWWFAVLAGRAFQLEGDAHNNLLFIKSTDWATDAFYYFIQHEHVGCSSYAGCPCSTDPIGTDKTNYLFTPAMVVFPYFAMKDWVFCIINNLQWPTRLSVSAQAASGLWPASGSKPNRWWCRYMGWPQQQPPGSMQPITIPNPNDAHAPPVRQGMYTTIVGVSPPVQNVSRNLWGTVDIEVTSYGSAFPRGVPHPQYAASQFDKVFWTANAEATWGGSLSGEPAIPCDSPSFVDVWPDVVFTQVGSNATGAVYTTADVGSATDTVLTGLGNVNGVAVAYADIAPVRDGAVYVRTVPRFQGAPYLEVAETMFAYSAQSMLTRCANNASCCGVEFVFNPQVDRGVWETSTCNGTGTNMTCNPYAFDVPYLWGMGTNRDGIPYFPIGNVSIETAVLRYRFFSGYQCTTTIVPVGKFATEASVLWRKVCATSNSSNFNGTATITADMLRAAELRLPLQSSRRASHDLWVYGGLYRSDWFPNPPATPLWAQRPFTSIVSDASESVPFELDPVGYYTSKYNTPGPLHTCLAFDPYTSTAQCSSGDPSSLPEGVRVNCPGQSQSKYELYTQQSNGVWQRNSRGGRTDSSPLVPLAVPECQCYTDPNDMRDVNKPQSGTPAPPFNSYAYRSIQSLGTTAQDIAAKRCDVHVVADTATRYTNCPADSMGRSCSGVAYCNLTASTDARSTCGANNRTAAYTAATQCGLTAQAYMAKTRSGLFDMAEIQRFAPADAYHVTVCDIINKPVFFAGLRGTKMTPASLASDGITDAGLVDLLQRTVRVAATIPFVQSATDPNFAGNVITLGSPQNTLYYAPCVTIGRATCTSDLATQGCPILNNPPATPISSLSAMQSIQYMPFRCLANAAVTDDIVSDWTTKSKNLQDTPPNAHWLDGTDGNVVTHAAAVAEINAVCAALETTYPVNLDCAAGAQHVSGCTAHQCVTGAGNPGCPSGRSGPACESYNPGSTNWFDKCSKRTSTYGIAGLGTACAPVKAATDDSRGCVWPTQCASGDHDCHFEDATAKNGVSCAGVNTTGRVGCVHGYYDWTAEVCVCDTGWSRPRDYVNAHRFTLPDQSWMYSPLGVDEVANAYYRCILPDVRSSNAAVNLCMAPASQLNEARCIAGDWSCRECSGRGVCLDPAIGCQCQTGYYGRSCQLDVSSLCTSDPELLGVATLPTGNTLALPCSGHGSCNITAAVCACGADSVRDPACCNITAHCECVHGYGYGWTNTSCNQPFVETYGTNLTSNQCANNGVLTANPPTTAFACLDDAFVPHRVWCECDPRWTGMRCEIPMCPIGPTGLVCNGQGLCQDDGTGTQTFTCQQNCGTIKNLIGSVAAAPCAKLTQNICLDVNNFQYPDFLRWKGAACEIDTWAYCKNGDLVCSGYPDACVPKLGNYKTTYYCDCSKASLGSTGQYCSINPCINPAQPGVYCSGVWSNASCVLGVGCSCPTQTFSGIYDASFNPQRQTWGFSFASSATLSNLYAGQYCDVNVNDACGVFVNNLIPGVPMKLSDVHEGNNQVNRFMCGLGVTTASLVTGQCLKRNDTWGCYCDSLGKFPCVATVVNGTTYAAQTCANCAGMLAGLGTGNATSAPTPVPTFANVPTSQPTRAPTAAPTSAGYWSASYSLQTLPNVSIVYPQTGGGMGYYSFTVNVTNSPRLMLNTVGALSAPLFATSLSISPSISTTLPGLSFSLVNGSIGGTPRAISQTPQAFTVTIVYSGQTLVLTLYLSVLAACPATGCGAYGVCTLTDGEASSRCSCVGKGAKTLVGQAQAPCDVTTCPANETAPGYNTSICVCADQTKSVASGCTLSTCPLDPVKNETCGVTMNLDKANPLGVYSFDGTVMGAKWCSVSSTTGQSACACTKNYYLDNSTGLCKPWCDAVNTQSLDYSTSPPTCVCRTDDLQRPWNPATGCSTRVCSHGGNYSSCYGGGQGCTAGCTCSYPWLGGAGRFCTQHVCGYGSVSCSVAADAVLCANGTSPTCRCPGFISGSTCQNSPCNAANLGYPTPDGTACSCTAPAYGGPYCNTSTCPVGVSPQAVLAPGGGFTYQCCNLDADPGCNGTCVSGTGVFAAKDANGICRCVAPFTGPGCTNLCVTPGATAYKDPAMCKCPSGVQYPIWRGTYCNVSTCGPHGQVVYGPNSVATSCLCDTGYTTGSDATARYTRATSSNQVVCIASSCNGGSLDLTTGACVACPTGCTGVLCDQSVGMVACSTVGLITPSPTSAPTSAPTKTPTTAPTAVPTAAPTTLTARPTAHPTSPPTSSPTTTHPTAVPTSAPSFAPGSPTPTPTTRPTSAPTSFSTPTPTSPPSSSTPTVAPTITPTTALGGVPTSPTPCPTSPCVAPNGSVIACPALQGCTNPNTGTGGSGPGTGGGNDGGTGPILPPAQAPASAATALTTGNSWWPWLVCLTIAVLFGM